jgi:transglutaminase-like putative cysteine protease
MMTRLLRPLLRWPWPTILLLVSITTILTYSVNQANWVQENPIYANAFWLGLLCGSALVISQFRERTALGYTLFVSLAAASEAIGHLLPSLDVLQTLPKDDVIWLMHVRFLTLADRLGGWVYSLGRGQPVKDIGFFTFLAIVVAWNASVCLVWSVARRRRALEGLLPVGFLLAINNHLSNQPLRDFVIFIGCAVLLMALTAFTTERGDWTRRRIDYPEELGVTWSLSAVAVALSLSLLARGAPLVGTPQGWQALSDLVRISRLRTADTAEQLFSGVNPPKTEDVAASARTPDLELIGAPLPQGREAIMWVLVSDAAPPPANVVIPGVGPPQHYWRNTIFAGYTGRGWDPLQFPGFPSQAPVPDESPPGRYTLRQHFEIIAPHGQTLFAVNQPVKAEGRVQLKSQPFQNAIVEGLVNSYDVTSWATAVTANELITASTVYPSEIISTYLQLPDNLPVRVRGLANRITAGATTPYDKAIRVQTYLRTTYPYRVDVPAPPAGRDAVDYFLFDAPGGFCSYYASAMAVLLRLEGVPARVVTGFATGDFDYVRAAYRVPADAAHAWVEVYFPGYGWVEFEPTAARTEFEYALETGPVAVATPTEPLVEVEIHYGWTPVLWVGGILLAIVALTWVLPRLRRPGTPRAQAQALYWNMRRALARTGLSAPASMTPDEFLTASTRTLLEQPALLAVLDRITTLYLRATFSRRPVSDFDTQTASAAWQAVWPDWFKLWMRRRTVGKKKDADARR